MPMYSVISKSGVQVCCLSNLLILMLNNTVVPLYWSQPSYGLKPPPQLSRDRTPGQNRDAMKRHFGRLINMYGPLTIVNLAEQRGKEAPVANAYRDRVSEVDLKDVL